MNTYAAIILVWSVAYFGKVSGLIDFSWWAFVLPLIILLSCMFIVSMVAKTLSQTLSEQTVQKMYEQMAKNRRNFERGDIG